MTTVRSCRQSDRCPSERQVSQEETRSCHQAAVGRRVRRHPATRHASASVRRNVRWSAILQQRHSTSKQAITYCGWQRRTDAAGMPAGSAEPAITSGPRVESPATAAPSRMRSRSPTKACGRSQGVSFDLRAGEVHALVGENGAGKSTLIKVITGAVDARRRDADALTVSAVPRMTPARLARTLGIAAIYQQPSLFPAPHRRREHRAGARDGAARGGGSTGAARARVARGPARAGRRRDRPGAAGRDAQHARAADGRDRQGARRRRAASSSWTSRPRR